MKKNSIYHFLKEHAANRSEKIAFSFPLDGVSVTYGAFFEQTKIMATHLQSLTQDKKCPIIIALPQNMNYVLSIAACALAGVPFVPLYQMSSHKFGSRMGDIFNSIGQAIVLTEDSSIRELITDNDECEVMLIDQIPKKSLGSYLNVTIEPDAPFFIQFSSGSTGSPKGICISWTNLLTNVEIINKNYYINSEDILVNWLPFYHDMSLVANVLSTMILGLTSVNIRPDQFLRNPYVWLKQISDWKATVTGSPTMALDVSSKRIKEEQLAELDLSSLKCFYLGGEPISSTSMKNFSNKFKQTGFRVSSFYPSYGLAEGTLVVSGRKQKEGMDPLVTQFSSQSIHQGKVELFSENQGDKPITLTGNGMMHSPIDVKIIDLSNGKELSENQIGEVCSNSPSNSIGILNETNALQAVESYTIKDKEYIRTGDIGFFHKDQLYITGRLKDIIVIHGNNYSALAIEKLLSQEVETLSKMDLVAISILVEAQEKLIIIVGINTAIIDKEIEESIYSDIQFVLSKHLHIVPYEIMIVQKSAFTRTTSGKIRRFEMKKKVESQSLKVIKSNNT